MKQVRIFRLAILTLTITASVTALGQRPDSAARTKALQAQPWPAARVVELKASDGTLLKASYFAAVKPGPGIVLIHQVNRTRKTWNDVARQLAAAGINTLTIDMRGHGESGGMPYDKLTDAELDKMWRGNSDDVETALRYLLSQPGVDRNLIGLGGAGLLGVDNAVEVARHHIAEVKCLVLLSGKTFHDGLEFLRKASQIPELFVVADRDEYPPTVEAMELLYITASSPSKKFVHYSATHDAPWLWYEPFDIGRVPATGSHGTDLFETHPELPSIIVDWFVTSLIRTPGQAPPDTVAAAPIINLMQTPGGVAQAKELLLQARQKNPKAQLWPEITVDIIGEDHIRVGETKAALEIFELNVLAYPDSADAHSDLADAYLADGQKGLARQHAERALALLDPHSLPASSWSDTEQRRGRIRHSAQRVLDHLAANGSQGTTHAAHKK